MPDLDAFTSALDPSMTRKTSRLGRALRDQGVKETSEFKRIADIPVRRLQGTVDVAGMSALFRLPDNSPLKCRGDCKGPGSEFCKGGNLELFPDQANAIGEMVRYGGAFVGTDVGSGKSLMMLLGALAVGAQRPLFCMPANAREGFENVMIPFMRRHFKMPDNLRIVSYETLSSASNKGLLTSIMPDWVFCDEAHNLKNEEISRGLKFMRYFDAFPDTRLACFSGSFLDRSIEAFAHLLYLCLRHSPYGCPLPYRRETHINQNTKEIAGKNAHAEELTAWAKAVDADVEDEDRYAPGALSLWLDLLSPDERALCVSDRISAQKAFGARLRTCPGVVFSSAPTSNRRIVIRELAVSIPANIRDAFEVLRETWDTPQGDTIADAAHLYAVVRQLAQGFFYRWVWPVDPLTGEEVKDLIWLDARKNWHRKIRTAISYGRFDSMAEVKAACEAHELYELARQTGMRDIVEQYKHVPRVDSQEFRNWQLVKNRYVPVTATTWIDKFLVHRVAEWLDERPGIAWVESSAMGDAIRGQGFRYYRGGENEIIYETVSCAAALKAHKEAKNLQAFDRNLIVTPPGKGKDWEQLIGRTDRTGQKSQTITVDLFLHARELFTSFYKARRDAEFAQAPGTPQKLCKAELNLITTDEAFPLKTFGDDPLWKFNKAPPK